jgi:DNA repair protein RecO (recombination protein O)
MSRRRTQNEPAYVLHRWPYSESSLLIDVFSRNHGRVMLIAKGARRLKSKMRGTLLPFQGVLVGWSGRGEVRTLTGAEITGANVSLRGEPLMCAYYLNELLLRLLHRDDAHERLFDIYDETLAALAVGDTEMALRSFERSLLEEIGYAMVLDTPGESDTLLESEYLYRYLPERGPVVDQPDLQDGVPVHGESLLAFTRGDPLSERSRIEIKGLTRFLLARQLEGRRLLSREVFRQMNRLRSAAFSG